MNNDVKCSFCGKHKDDVSRIIAGPNVHICEECVNVCADVLKKDS